MKEKEEPLIENLIPDIDATYKSKDITKIHFTVDDKLSGLSSIDNISVKIDNFPILFEYNPYRKEVFYEFDELLSTGKHLLEIEIKDNVGNLKLVKGNFIIKQAPANCKLSLFVNSIEPLNKFIISLEIESPKPEWSSLKYSLSV